MEAILSKSDDDESPFGSPGGVGTKTLLGMNAADLVPPGAPFQGPGGDGQHDGHDGIDIKSEDPISGVTVDDLFADSDDEPRVVTKTRASVDDTQVGTLLGEVAEALNVQASESRQRALGRSSSAPSAFGAARPAPPEELEFEDPDDGPTSLNSKAEKEEAEAEAADRAGRSKADDDEEAVVLGPARNSGAHAVSSTARGASRPLPGARRPTPFGGSPATLPTFPTPPGGRSRLPTPAPGQAVNVPAPAGGRLAPPPGRPSAGHATLDAPGAVPGPASGRDSSRRTTARAATPSGGSAPLDGSGIVGESLAAAAMTTASLLLKKDLHLRLMSLAAIVVLTFVGGMLLGRLKGGEVKVAAESATGEAARTIAKPAARPEEVAPTGGGAPHPAAATPVVAAPTPAILPTAPEKGATPPAGTEAPAAVAAVDPQPLRKPRPRRANPVARVDVADIGSAPRTAGRAAPFPGPAPAAPKPVKKAKSGWHDPFAD